MDGAAVLMVGEVVGGGVVGDWVGTRVGDVVMSPAFLYQVGAPRDASSRQREGERTSCLTRPPSRPGLPVEWGGVWGRGGAVADLPT